MINVQDLRSGTAFLLDGQPCVALKYEHVKMGRGSATIRIKLKNLVTGAVIDKSFINSARVEEITTVRRARQFLYRDGDDWVFMDPQTYDQSSVIDSVVGESRAYLKEGVIANILYWEDRPLWIELPPKMEFTVVQTDPGVKGNSAANMYKSAKLDTGLVVRVPLFIAEGDKILVDTRDGSYAERVKDKV